jgi:hypothetical protein
MASSSTMNRSRALRFDRVGWWLRSPRVPLWLKGSGAGSAGGQGRRRNGDRAGLPGSGGRSPERWSDGKTYDAVGNFDGKYFDQQWQNLQNQIVKHLGKADYVLVDVAKFTPEQIAKIEQFIGPLGPRVFLVGGWTGRRHRASFPG